MKTTAGSPSGPTSTGFSTPPAPSWCSPGGFAAHSNCDISPGSVELTGRHIDGHRSSPQRCLRQTGVVNDRAPAQLEVIKAVTKTSGPLGSQPDCSAGGASTRGSATSPASTETSNSGVERVNAERSKTVLMTAAATALSTQPPAEACEFTWAGTEFSTAYFDRQLNGGFSQPDGRWSDWLFPPDSF